MSTRELIALGTASQVPTRERNHNGYLLRWDEQAILFDPGEGTQRQLTFADLRATSIHHICITHFHGDHCLGLSGILQRISLDGCSHPVYVHFPESGQDFFNRLSSASIYRAAAEVIPSPIPDQTTGLYPIFQCSSYTLFAHTLEHTVPTCGFRLEEPSRRHFVSDKLEALGISGPAVGELARAGRLEIGTRTVTVDEVTEEREGSAFAFAMDTRPCEGSISLARGADLLVMEATYTEAERELAANYGHSTAAAAADIALRADARMLALTHFSQRYSDAAAHLSEARAIFANTVALNDFDRIVIPRRK